MVITWDLQNKEPRFIVMVLVHHAQKQRALSTSLISKHLNLNFARHQTGVVGAVAALAQRTGLAHTHHPRRYAISKNIADIDVYCPKP